MAPANCRDAVVMVVRVSDRHDAEGVVVMAACPEVRAKSPLHCPCCGADNDGMGVDDGDSDDAAVQRKHLLCRQPMR